MRKRARGERQHVTGGLQETLVRALTIGKLPANLLVIDTGGMNQGVIVWRESKNVGPAYQQECCIQGASSRFRDA
jgi:hypothetical protein